jgi:hypothetical protein
MFLFAKAVALAAVAASAANVTAPGAGIEMKQWHTTALTPEKALGLIQKCAEH